jgi:hypothetical protein
MDEDLFAPKWTCPFCGHEFRMRPYDIGSGPEVSCSNCEMCWGADGQPLKPLEHKTIAQVLAEAKGHPCVKAVPKRETT